ncbi:MAG: NTP transferase domain-containing protein [Patescibacteria group bacterium]|jgi:bifunctional UDP-N-acetylglucosamine pyrophosphorylase/glucosamine-1-phosphate N-acetyltransferase
MSQNTRVVILAAGKGKRMGAEVPKALVPISGRPMIDYLVDSVIASGVDTKPIVVIGYGAKEIGEHLGERCEYAFQQEPLGTGHALRCALPLLEESQHVVVLYGDHAFVSSETIKRLAETCVAADSLLTLMVVKTPDFEGWRQAFENFARIVRGADGEVKKIIEKKDATEEELKIKEVNPGYYCFRVDWLKENIEKIGNKNAQGEFYLTDLIGLATSQGISIKTIEVDDPLEGVGVNTPEQLKMAEAAFAEKK